MGDFMDDLHSYTKRPYVKRPYIKRSHIIKISHFKRRNNITKNGNQEYYDIIFTKAYLSTLKQHLVW